MTHIRAKLHAAFAVDEAAVADAVKPHGARELLHGLVLVTTVTQQSRETLTVVVGKDCVQLRQPRSG